LICVCFVLDVWNEWRSLISPGNNSNFRLGLLGKFEVKGIKDNEVIDLTGED
jgi:hypothetical protein